MSFHAEKLGFEDENYYIIVFLYMASGKEKKNTHVVYEEPLTILHRLQQPHVVSAQCEIEQLETTQHQKNRVQKQKIESRVET